jgi:hypothetical protein
LTAEGLDYVHRFLQFTAGLQDLIKRHFAEAFEDQDHTLIATADKDGSKPI